MRFKYALVPFLFLLSCSSSSFDFDYYGIDHPRYDEGKLDALSEDTEDLQFRVCEPTDADGTPCVVMLSAEYFKMAREFVRIKERLRACESGE